MNGGFNIFSWSGDIPLCDDLWLGMQARNIAIVDQIIIRRIEQEALEAYHERDRTPTDILLVLSALSQMWVFSLYEFLRTWRQRARGLLKLADECAALPETKRAAFIRGVVAKARDKERFIKVAPTFYSEHVKKIGDKEFADALRAYFDKTDGLFRGVEGLRVTLAKHEVPKTPGLVAEAPGYGRMDLYTGGLYWHFALNDGSLGRVSRRELGNGFLGIDEDISDIDEEDLGGFDEA